MTKSLSWSNTKRKCSTNNDNFTIGNVIKILESILHEEQHRLKYNTRVK